MISLSQVHKFFGPVHAVRGVTLEIPKGQVVGILGPNGAGKTTTIRMITAAIPPTSGRVVVAGMDAVDRSIEVRRRLGYMPEASGLYREMRVSEFLRYRAGLHGLSGASRKKAVARCADQCRLTEVLQRRTGALSKGYKQRVGLAAALLHEPDLLVLDEPTSGLDPAQIAETRGLIRELAGRRTMLIVSHILHEVEKSCDRIVLFAAGRILADGPPDKLIEAMPGAGRYVMEVSGGSSAEAHGTISRLRGIDRITSEGISASWSRWSVTFVPGTPDRREDLARAAGAAGMLVRELRAETPSLEDVYLRLLAAQDPARGVEARGAA